jgi:EAL domain-containing protein (putative c-di-GMP-specific phosphodiesterase class I)
VFPQDGTDADTLLQHAETAMSCAKKMNGNNYQFYSRALDTESMEELQLENNLRSALSNNELDIFYQPKVDVATNTIVGMEALIRWHHPSKGLILPSVFLSLAEKTGIIHEIGLWVFSRACEQAKAWHDLGFNDFSVAVNISATQFAREGFLEQVTMIINNSGVDPQHIEIEVTEHTMLHNIETVSTIVKQLRELGIRASLDDFGTGYSSLHYIKRFPVDALKIDISFIQNICTDTDDIAIVSAIITMAHAMNLKVIAEGVENNEQLEILRKLHCDQIQGYIFSRAKPSDEATALLHSQHHSEIRQPFTDISLATS